MREYTGNGGHTVEFDFLQLKLYHKFFKKNTDIEQRTENLTAILSLKLELLKYYVLPVPGAFGLLIVLCVFWCMVLKFNIKVIQTPINNFILGFCVHTDDPKRIY